MRPFLPVRLVNRHLNRHVSRRYHRGPGLPVHLPRPRRQSRRVSRYRSPHAGQRVTRHSNQVVGQHKCRRQPSQKMCRLECLPRLRLWSRLRLQFNGKIEGAIVLQVKDPPGHPQDSLPIERINASVFVHYIVRTHRRYQVQGMGREIYIALCVVI